MATDANGNPIPNIDPQLAGILNSMSVPNWPRPAAKRTAGDVVIPAPAAPPVTDADTNPVNVTDSNPPIAYPDPSVFASRGAVGEATGYAGRPAPSIPTTAPIEPNPASVADVSNIGAAAATNPALGPVLQRNRAFMQPPGNYQPAPSYMQASTDPATGLPTAAGPQTKLGKLLSILRGAGIGAAIGSTQPTFGRGLMAANEWEDQQARERQQLQMGGLQAMMARQQLALAPQEMQLRAAQLQGQMAMLPLQQQLLQAQAQAARYKEDPNLGLVDVSTGQPISSAGLVPLTAEQATVLGKNAGDRVPLKMANTADEIAGRGWSTINTDEGVYQYNRITQQLKRMGSNPRQIQMELPVPVYDKQMNAGKGGQTYATRAEIAANPSRYASTQADVQLPMIKQTVKDFASTKPGTAGGNAIAFNTAIGHLGMLWDAIQALNNGNVPAFNSLAQRYAQETGSSVPTNFNTIRGAVNAEVAKVFKGGVPTDADIQNEDRNASVASSPQQLRDNVRILLGLMNSRLNTLQDRYQSIMGEPNEDLINKESQGVLQKIQGGGGGQITVRDPRGGIHTFPDQAAADKFRRAAGIQ